MARSAPNDFIRHKSWPLSVIARGEASKQSRGRKPGAAFWIAEAAKGRLAMTGVASEDLRPPPAQAGMRIGLLGGSFNPPHAAHRLITLTALKRLRLDQVWWMVTPGNPLKEHSGLLPLARRIRLCRQVEPSAHRGNGFRGRDWHRPIRNSRSASCAAAFQLRVSSG